MGAEKGSIPRDWAARDDRFEFAVKKGGVLLLATKKKTKKVVRVRRVLRYAEQGRHQDKRKWAGLLRTIGDNTLIARECVRLRVSRVGVEWGYEHVSWLKEEGNFLASIICLTLLPRRRLGER